MHIYRVGGPLLVGYLYQLGGKCLLLMLDVLIVMIFEGTCFLYIMCKLSSSFDCEIFVKNAI